MRACVLTAIAGTVLDIDGVAAAEFIVNFTNAESTAELARIQPIKDGKFLIEVNGAADGEKIPIRIDLADRLPITIYGIQVEQGKTTDLGVLRFHPCGALEVSIETTTGIPVPGIPLVVSPSSVIPVVEYVWMVDGLHELPPRGVTTIKTTETFVTNSDGYYRFPILAAGDYLVSPHFSHGLAAEVEKKLARKGSAASDINKLSKDERCELGQIDPEYARVRSGETGKIRFVVSDLEVIQCVALENGKPLRNAKLAIIDHCSKRFRSTESRVETDSQGRFQFGPTPVGPYRIYPITKDDLSGDPSGVESTTV